MKHLMHLILPLLLISAASAPTGSTDKTRRGRTTAYTEPFGTVFNINRISGWIYADGTSGNAPNGDAGIIFPRGTANVIYQDGIVWDGYVRDENPQNPRAGGQTYLTGTQPGYIAQPGNGINPPVASDPQDPRAHIYRIRSDYQTMSDAEIRADAAELLLKDPGDVTPAEMAAVRSRYAADWADWPYDLGAPFHDINGDGIYEPDQGEAPGLAGADEVIWFVCNDLDSGLTKSLYGSDPMGIELQVTVWAYKDSLLQDVVYRRYRLINKSGVDMDSMFIGFFIDTDLGNYTDDFMGCDTSLNLVYAYNAFPTDAAFAPFNLPPPAIGCQLLQGSLIPDIGEEALFDFKTVMNYRNQTMTSIWYKGSGMSVSDPDIGRYDGTLQMYNLLNGYLPSYDLSNPRK